MGKRNITKSEYNKIKTLTNVDGLKVKQVCEITGRSQFTVGKIKLSSDFSDYRRIVQEHYNRSHPKKEEAASVQQAAKFESNEVDLAVAINNLNQSLVELARAWNNLSEKMDEVLETKRPWISNLKRG